MATSTCLRIVTIAIDLFYLLTGIALFVGAIWLTTEFPTSTELLAPQLAKDQSLVAIIGVAVVGVLMLIGSVFGGYGTMKNRDIWIVVSSSILAPCFATLVSLAVCILIYQKNLFERVQATMLYEAEKNISTGLLKTGYTKYGCCGSAEIDVICDQIYQPKWGQQLFNKGCPKIVWNNLFMPYIHVAISALFTISGILLAGMIIDFIVYRSIAEENEKNRRRDRAIPLVTNNRAIKEE